MLVELYGHAIRGGSYAEAAELLDMPSGSVRLKIGRPDITSSVFSVHGDHEVIKGLTGLHPVVIEAWVCGGGLISHPLCMHYRQLRCDGILCDFYMLYYPKSEVGSLECRHGL
jgi:hypothetical protein